MGWGGGVRGMRRAGVACDARDDSEGGGHGDGDGRDHALSSTIVHVFQKGVHSARRVGGRGGRGLTQSFSAW